MLENGDCDTFLSGAQSDYPCWRRLLRGTRWWQAVGRRRGTCGQYNNWPFTGKDQDAKNGTPGHRYRTAPIISKFGAGHYITYPLGCRHQHQSDDRPEAQQDANKEELARNKGDDAEVNIVVYSMPPAPAPIVGGSTKVTCGQG